MFKTPYGGRCMGVDISGILEKKPIELTDLKGQTLAVDAFNTIYQFITIIRQPDGTPLMDNKGRVTSHLSGLFYRTCSILEKGITPIFVFDGAPHELKKATLDARKEAKLEAMERMKQAIKEGDLEEAGRMAQRTAKITQVEIDESKQLLTLMGLPYIQAKSEGEAQCAYMAATNVVNAAASQDYDSLLFGAPIHVRNMTIAGKRKLPRRNMTVEVKPEIYDLNENLSALRITREKLIWIALLCGTDFNAGVHGIGAKKGLKLVLKHNSFDELLKEIEQEMDWKPVYELFTNPPVVDVQKEQVQRKPYNPEGIRKLMIDEHNFSVERVENSLKRAFNEPEDKGQSQLKQWF